jgi:TonB family protein
MTVVIEDEGSGHDWMKRLLVTSVVLGLMLAVPAMAVDIEVGARHVRHYVRPNLPDVAKRMNLKGSVKLEVEIAPSGKVTAVRTLGGHPVLAESATEAVREWQFDAAKESTTGPVTVTFQ